MTFNLYEYQSILEKENIILNYKGPLDDDILEKIVSFIRGKSYPNMKTSRRLVSVFIELAQNIARYSSEMNSFEGLTGVGVGSISLHETEKALVLVAGNLVNKDKANKLISKIEFINSLNHIELRKERRYVLKKEREENARGASLGLIEIAMKTDLPLKVYLTESNKSDQVFFTTEATIFIEPIQTDNFQNSL